MPYNARISTINQRLASCSSKLRAHQIVAIIFGWHSARLFMNIDKQLANSLFEEKWRLPPEDTIFFDSIQEAILQKIHQENRPFKFQHKIRSAQPTTWLIRSCQRQHEEIESFLEGFLSFKHNAVLETEIMAALQILRKQIVMLQSIMQEAHSYKSSEEISQQRSKYCDIHRSAATNINKIIRCCLKSTKDC